MLVEIAIGDAYGAGFEFASSDTVRAYNDLTGYISHKAHNLEAGRYTDDTQMSLAVAEAVISEEPWTPELLAGKFVEAFKRDPRVGYAGRFYGFLKEVSDGVEFLSRIRPFSEKSGAAMRAGPIGVFPTVAEVIEKADIQARITHDTPKGRNAAVASALVTHYFLYNLGPKSSLGEFLEAHVEGEWSQKWRGPVGSKGWMSVRAAITALTEEDRLSEVLRRCVAFEGDVDTVAAIALGAGSCSRELDQDLLQVLYDYLENGPFGRDYLAAMDKKLLAKVGKRSKNSIS